MEIDEIIDQVNDREDSNSTQVEHSSTQVKPSSASQEEVITQEEPHTEEQTPKPQRIEQDLDGEHESSTPQDHTQVVVHGQHQPRGEFLLS
jgi:hypothetical protein